MGQPTETPEDRPLRVLLVDDDPVIGAILARLLRPWSVLVVQSAAGALARIEAGEPFDAVVCDLSMPGMSGVELHRAVAGVNPSLARRMVFVTGGASTAEAAEFLEHTSNQVLLKPVERAALRRAVADAAQLAG